jgi:hypothetical protein
MSQSILSVEERRVKTRAEEIITLESLIKSHVNSLDQLKDELKTKREMYKDSFTNNPTYREYELMAKEATQEKLRVKMEIAKKSDVAKLEQEIKDIRFDIKESKKTLSSLLLEYKERTKATQLELFDGQLFEIVQTATIIKGKRSFRK